jgi:death-on-curing protein
MQTVQQKIISNKLGLLSLATEELFDCYYWMGCIRTHDLLESAIMTPQASFGGQYVHNGIFEMAAAYAFHIAENQPFVDGNKRTALAASLVFLDWHQIEINDSGDELYNAMIGLAKKNLDKAGLAKLFQKLAKPAKE